jgi:hypothetical protein
VARAKRRARNSSPTGSNGRLGRPGSPATRASVPGVVRLPGPAGTSRLSLIDGMRELSRRDAGFVTRPSLSAEQRLSALECDPGGRQCRDLAMTDRHLRAAATHRTGRSPRAIDGPPKGPRWRRQTTAHLTQIVIDNGLADRASQRLKQLANPDARAISDRPSGSRRISGLNDWSTPAFGDRW